MERSTHARAVTALHRAFARAHPETAFDRKGYVGDWMDNLLPGTDPASFQAELEGGDGSELKKKFCAVHSSAALAVNCFARFKREPVRLTIDGFSGFDTIRFEAKCPAGIQGRRPPNLDMLLGGLDSIIGVESKLTEHLRTHEAMFSRAYDEQIIDMRRESPWFALMHTLMREPRRYRHLDAAQLVKHAFGLGHSFARRPVTLLYLYWEPRNAAALPELFAHRAEVARFSAEVAGATPSFRALSYPALWASWAERNDDLDWLDEHVSRLRARYDVEI